MKVKEAVEKLNGQIISIKEIHALYFSEAMSRAKMRAHGKDKISMSLMEGVLDEMDDWIVKVCQGIGWSEDDCRNAQVACRTVADLSARLAVQYHGLKKY